jgi:thymidylate synthase (FAD)
MTNKQIPVLDHGFVRLVDNMGSDLSVVRSARVSYDAAWRSGVDKKSDHRLIHYLWKNGHTSPFESVTFTFEVKAPIFILRQWHRHRTWAYNELSARYRHLPEEFYVPKPEHVGQQSAGNKQCRDMEGERHDSASAIRDACAASFRAYNRLLSDGVPREIARSVLPVATYSHMFGTVNLLNLLKFLSLRDHEHAQWEIQQYAQAMQALAEPIVPTSMAAWRSSREK